MVKAELVEICKKVYANKFVAATDGNLSVINDKGNIYITPSGKCKGEVEEKDILEIDIDGNLISGSGKITTEYKLHTFFYKNKPEIKSVIHCHPVYASAFAVAGKNINSFILPEVLLTLGKIALCEYASPSTDELALSIKPFINESCAYILKNHGAVTIGNNLKQAYYRMEKLEHTAKIQLLAESLGGAKEISKDKIIQLAEIAGKVYGLNISQNIIKDL